MPLREAAAAAAKAGLPGLIFVDEGQGYDSEGPLRNDARRTSGGRLSLDAQGPPFSTPFAPLAAKGGAGEAQGSCDGGHKRISFSELPRDNTIARRSFKKFDSFVVGRESSRTGERGMQGPPWGGADLGTPAGTVCATPLFVTPIMLPTSLSFIDSDDQPPRWRS